MKIKQKHKSGALNEVGNVVSAFSPKEIGIGNATAMEQNLTYYLYNLLITEVWSVKCSIVV